MDIVWRTPPELNRKSPKKRPGPKTKYLDIADLLRANPGRWALFTETMTTGLAHRIKFGVLRDFQPAGAFEAVTRDVDPDTQQAAIYVRYIGNEED